MAEATSSLTYQKFVQFALEETRKHTHLAPSALQVTVSTYCGACDSYWVLGVYEKD